jgi:hypothetical protein
MEMSENGRGFQIALRAGGRELNDAEKTQLGILMSQVEYLLNLAYGEEETLSKRGGTPFGILQNLGVEIRNFRERAEREVKRGRIVREREGI